MLAASIVIGNNYQVAVMAPTADGDHLHLHSDADVGPLAGAALRRCRDGLGRCIGGLTLIHIPRHGSFTSN